MNLELSDRKKRILKSVISDYVETAEPIGSFTIKRQHLHDISSATIRNEMKELESLGLITHPHTSAGRIPTDKGYRYYVDNLMKKRQVSKKESYSIKAGIKKIGRGMEEILRGTLRAVSSILDYASIIVTFGRQKPRVYSAGVSHILKQPEFQDIKHARHLLEAIEKEEPLAKMFEEFVTEKEIVIKIGHENRYKIMQDCSVVIAQYSIKGYEPGAFGIIGPTRMSYNRVQCLLDFVKNELNSLPEGDL